jgi:quercetin dioxygenase-like cupin family protein
MGNPLFSEIGIIRAGELEPGPITPGQIRSKALEVGDLWIGECQVTALDQPSQWHHHKDFDSVMYMLSGRIRVDHGPGGKKSFELGAGDYAYFPRRVIHRAQILEGDDVRYVFVRVGKGETLENVDRPDA